MSDSSLEKQELKTNNINVSQLVVGASDPAFVIDDFHQIVAWNDCARQLLGYTAREVIGHRCEEILQAVLPNGEPLCRPNCELFQCFCSCHPSCVPTCKVRCKNGDWRSVSYSSLVMSGQVQETPNGSAVAMVFLHEKEEQHVQQQPQGGQLQIHTLGKFGLSSQGRGIDVDKWKRRQAITLLKLLVTHLDRPVHREKILDCLWPDVDEERGWGRLKVTMYYLRSQLRESGIDGDTVQTVGGAYLLRRDSVWIDAEAFEKLVAEGRELQSRGQIEEAIRCYDEAQFLYRGNYLEQDVFDDCFAEERERLSELYMELLTRKAECHALRQEYVEAVQVCRKALVQDPCRESFHCSLMKYLVCLQRVDWAIAQFRHCKAVLAREFGVEPMPETQRLYQEILARSEGKSTNENSPPPAISVSALHR